MPLLSSATVLGLVNSMAILLSQAYQLARARLASAGSPVLRLLVQRDQEATEGDLLRREVEIFRAQRGSLPPHRRVRGQILAALGEGLHAAALSAFQYVRHRPLW